MKNDVPYQRLKMTADLPDSGYVVIDTETTGLEPGKDEVLSVAVVDPDGNELFYSLVRPIERRRWPKAAKIHGITWSDVKDKPTIEEIGAQVASLLREADLIVGYNVEFDMRMLVASGMPQVDTQTYDLMPEYARAYGEWSEWKNDYIWMKLSQCADMYGYRFTAHNALDDAKATAHCFRAFKRECAKELPLMLERESAAAERRKRRNVIIAVIIAVLVIGGILAFAFNPNLFWGVLGVALILLFLLGKVAKGITS